jgi:beta-phosphoglucomutase-like phosphatase (HAD superfamily)
LPGVAAGSLRAQLVAGFRSELDLSASPLPVEACSAFEDSDNGARGAASADMAVAVVPELKSSYAEVAELSFRMLGKLDVAIEQVADWLRTRDTKFP